MTVNEVDPVVPFDRRPWRRRLRSWRPLLVTVGVLVVVAVAAWVVFLSSWLGLRSVQVDGAHQVTSSQVVAAAHVAPGTPLVRVNLDAVRTRVEAIPAVASATVSRSWPHSLVIHVTERQPVAVTHHDGAWWVMDRTGVLFAKAVTRTPDEPIVAVDPGASPQTLPQVGSVLGALPPTLLSSTRRVTASSMDSIALVLKNGSTVRWGSAADSAQKAVVLSALLNRKAAVYDVSIPSQPATRS